MTKGRKVDSEVIGKNPFLEGDFEITVSRKTDLTKLQLSDGDWIPQEFDLERSSVTKIYKSLKNREKINVLTAPAKELYLWLAYKITYGEDWIRVSRSEYMKEHGIASVNTYKGAVRDLVAGGVIAYSVLKDVFWINPTLFFCGSRVKKYPDKVKVYNPKKSD